MAAGSAKRSGANRSLGKLRDFELLREVGRGAMGSVFLARQSSLDRMVAVKILPPDLARNKDFVTRFIREARSVAALNHPNLIQGIDVGEANGHYFFAMEYIDGPTAMRRIKQRGGRVPEDEALDIILQIARALDHAWAHKMVHRDIKPDNILINAEGTAKLCDLGLAKLTVHEDAGLTQSGQAIGTPNYISPEQARGDEKIDIRSDLYSLGATLYHMVVGSPPYKGATNAVVMTMHLADPVPDAHKAHPDVSVELSGVIQRMMQKNPADRYKDPKELIADLERIRQGEAPDRAVQAGGARPAPRRARAPRSTGQQAPAPVRGDTTAHPPRLSTRVGTGGFRRAGRGSGALALLIVAVIAVAAGVYWFAAPPAGGSSGGKGRGKGATTTGSSTTKNGEGGSGGATPASGGVSTPDRGPVPQGPNLRNVSRDGAWGAALCKDRYKGATGVAVGDLDGDGLNEMILATESEPVRVFKNTSTAALEQTAALGLEDFKSRTAHVIDVNLDGRNDLAFLSADGLRVYLQKEGGGFVETLPNRRARFNNTEGSLWLDFNGDGRPDLLATDDRGVELLRNDPDRPREISGDANLGRWGMARGNGDWIIGADLNNDAWPDFIYNTGKDGVVALNQKGRRFEPGQGETGIRYTVSNDHKVGLAAADINGDGWVDVFIPQNGKPKLYVNDGAGKFKDEIGKAGALAKLSGKIWGAAFADLDLDGDQDLVVTLLDGVGLYLNDGKGVFADESKAGLRDAVRMQGISYAALFDANGDGMVDIFLYGRDRPSMMLLNERKPLPRAAPLRVRFDTAGRTSVGARVQVRDAWQRKQTQWVSGGDGRGGQTCGELIFGVPVGSAVISVTWPGGKTTETEAKVGLDRPALTVIKPPAD